MICLGFSHVSVCLDLLISFNVCRHPWETAKSSDMLLFSDKRQQENIQFQRFVSKGQCLLQGGYTEK